MTKGTIAEERRKNKSFVDEKGKRYAPQTGVGMDIDPKPSILSSQKEVRDYLMRYRSRLPSIITVELCPSTTDTKVSPPPGVCISTPISWHWGYRYL